KHLQRLVSNSGARHRKYADRRKDELPAADDKHDQDDGRGEPEEVPLPEGDEGMTAHYQNPTLG
ncbi:MAG: hypothetical protein ABI574_11750, partial [Burkholderiales bacterium]